MCWERVSIIHPKPLNPKRKPNAFRISREVELEWSPLAPSSPRRKHTPQYRHGPLKVGVVVHPNRILSIKALNP